MDRISSDFRRALRRHIQPVQASSYGSGEAKAPRRPTMHPTPPSRSAWAGPYYAGWLFLLGGLAVAAGVCWLVVTLLGCGKGCCGGVAW